MARTKGIVDRAWAETPSRCFCQIYKGKIHGPSKDIRRAYAKLEKLRAERDENERLEREKKEAEKNA